VQSHLNDERDKQVLRLSDNWRGANERYEYHSCQSFHWSSQRGGDFHRIDLEQAEIEQRRSASPVCTLARVTLRQKQCLTAL
jgi:hypothetical protein